MPSEEIQYFLAKQRVLSTHPDFNRDTRLLPQCQGWGLFSNGGITDMAEMLLRVGVLKLMQDYPTRDDLSLEHYHMNVDLKKIVRELYSIHNLFDEGVKKSLNRSIDIRNRFIHFSFMKPDVYTEELSNVFYTLFREVDEEIRKFKKKS